MGLNDVDFDAFLANDRTLTDPEVVRVERGGRVHIRIINGASSSQFWIDLERFTGILVAVDGHSVRPVAGQRFPIAMAQRLDLLIDLRGVEPFQYSHSSKGPHAAPESSSPREIRAFQRLSDRGPPAPRIDLSLETRLIAAEPLARVPRILSAPSRWRQHEALCLVDGRRDVAAHHAAHGKAGTAPWSLSWSTRRYGASDPSARPRIPSGCDRRPALPGRRARYRASHAQRRTGADRLRRRQSGSMGIPLHNLYHMQTGMLTEVRYDGIAV